MSEKIQSQKKNSSDYKLRLINKYWVVRLLNEVL